jgi:hypothetical protein
VSPGVSYFEAVFEKLRGRERERARRDLRRKFLTDLGWTIINDNVVFAPGEDPDDPSVIWNLTTAALEAGMPVDLDELYQWGRARAHERFFSEAGTRRQTSVDSPRTGDEQRPAGQSVESVRYAPVDEHITERASFSLDAQEREALRVESALVKQFAGHLEQMGREISSVAVRVDQELIRADLLDRTEGVLYEAKASADRQKIRMAIGQLLDYRRFVNPHPRLRVPVPVRPSPDLCALLAGAGIGATWPDNDGWCDMEPDALGSPVAS